MTATAEAFRHEALLHHGDDGFLATAVPFIRDGLAAGEPILVAVGEDKCSLLRGELGADARRVRFVDMRELGRNPGWIIPAWHDFLDEHRGARGIRGIGEPVWSGLEPAELVESQLHESLVNIAFAAVDGFRLLCPYDVDALDAHVLREARCSHRMIHNGTAGMLNPDFRDGNGGPAPFDAPLPDPAGPTRSLAFEPQSLPDLRECVADEAGMIGLPADKRDDLVLAVSEIAANSLRHGGGSGVLRVWPEGDALVCEIRDRGHIRDPLAGRRRPTAGRPGGWGLWLAHRVCDLVQVRTSPQGTTVRLSMRIA